MFISLPFVSTGLASTWSRLQWMWGRVERRIRTPKQKARKGIARSTDDGVPSTPPSLPPRTSLPWPESNRSFVSRQAPRARSCCEGMARISPCCVPRWRSSSVVSASAPYLWHARLCMYVCLCVCLHEYVILKKEDSWYIMLLNKHAEDDGYSVGKEKCRGAQGIDDPNLLRSSGGELRDRLANTYWVWVYWYIRDFG